MIYVDEATWKKSPNGRKTYAHMVADDLQELHDFAKRIGVKPHFFHKAKSGWHYDVNSDQQASAIQHGAQLVSCRVILEKAKNLMPASLGPISDAIRQFAKESRS